MNIKLTNIIIPFCGFYITMFPLSPIYFFYLFAFICILLLTIYTSRIVFNSVIAISFFVFFSFFISQLITGFDTSSFIGFLFSIAYFILSLIILNHSSARSILKASNRLINYSIYLLIVECIWRLSHPVYFAPNNSVAGGLKPLEGIYPYKISSIMYLDSNFVGVYIVCIFFFTLYLSNETEKKFKRQLLALFFLCILTFSRGAIISIILFYFFFKYLYLLKKIKLDYIILGILIFVLSLIYLYNSFSQDESFRSKFYVINASFNYLSNSDILTKLIGVGFGNTAEYLQMGAHNIIITYLFESGIIGILILASFWTYISIITHHKVLFVLIPFVFTGFALTTHAIPYLYCIFAIIYSLQEKRGNITEGSFLLR